MAKQVVSSMENNSKPEHAIPSPSAADVEMRLRQLGQRVTMQRVAILAAFAAGEHLAGDEVYERVAPAMPFVNRSTVYRALEQFRDVGLLSEIDLGDGFRRFELLREERHHHLVCLDCRCLIAFEDELVEPLRRAIAERHGFTPRIDHLALFGLCQACQAARLATNASGKGAFSPR